MLKKIHFAQPSVKYSEYVKHERNVEKLKKQISNGSTRLTMMQAARDVIVAKEKQYSSPGRANCILGKQS